MIGEVKNNPRVHIPIIGNGDITTPEEAKRAFEDYGVDAVMIGRATFGRPWVFQEVRDYLDGNPDAHPIYRGILHTRRHLAASPVFKGIPNFRQTRIAMLRATTMAELTAILDDCKRLLA